MEGQKKKETQDVVLPTVPKVIQISTYTPQAINKVVVQQILEVIGQITKNNIERSSAQMVLIQPLVLELY